MSAYYLLDHFVAPNPVVDVTQNDLGQVDATGVLVVRIPAGVSIHGQPKTLAELNTAKTAGLLGRYAGFTNCLYDPCVTNVNVDTAGSSKVLIASPNTTFATTNHCILSNGGVLATPKLSLDVAPTIYAVAWDAYATTTLDPIAGRTTRRYLDRDPSVLSCSVIFDDVAATTVVTGSGMTQPYTAATTLVTLKFTSLSSERIYLGSWAILYKA